MGLAAKKKKRKSELDGNEKLTEVKLRERLHESDLPIEMFRVSLIEARDLKSKAIASRSFAVKLRCWDRNHPRVWQAL